MGHEIDQFGRPIDPIIRQLEDQLDDLAAAWRGTHLEEVVREYGDIIDQLYQLGWDGSLHPQSELPSNLMPKEYLRRQHRLKD